MQLLLFLCVVVGATAFDYEEVLVSPENHTFVYEDLPQIGIAEPLSEYSKNVILGNHNAGRRIVRPSGADMREQRWNSNLESLALEWAKGCNFRHGQPARAKRLFPNGVGQNLYWGSGSRAMQQAFSPWFNERRDYDYNTGRCTKVCGHYTQIAWATSYQLGCAKASCSGSTYVVCNYNPPGNYVGRKPYIAGAPCSRCPSGTTCKSNLCV